MKALALLLLLPVQFKVPDNLPAPLPPEGSVCNEAGTLCMVNADDWAKLHDEVVDLRKRERTVKCATVTVIEARR